jgi:pimeloyl-ACP methyl ester carboxylesterase
VLTDEKVHIAYDDTGTGEPTIVLLHGLFENRTYFAAQTRHLARRHRVLNIDLRGHGESDVPGQGYSLDILAHDVARVCDGAGVTRAVFCGHSMAVALRVAVRRPDLAAGVVLLDGRVLLRPDANQGTAQLVKVLATDGWRDTLLGFFPSIAGAAAERVRRDIASVPRVYAAPILSDLATQAVNGDDADELAAIQCPLMYVHSAMPIDMERLHRVQPDAIVETIPGVGHYQMLTAPDEVNALLDRFLDVIA